MSYSIKMKYDIFNVVFIKNLPQTESLHWPVYKWLEIYHKVFLWIDCFIWTCENL